LLIWRNLPSQGSGAARACARTLYLNDENATIDVGKNHHAQALRGKTEM